MKGNLLHEVKKGDKFIIITDFAFNADVYSVTGYRMFYINDEVYNLPTNNDTNELINIAVKISHKIPQCYFHFCYAIINDKLTIILFEGFLYHKFTEKLDEINLKYIYDNKKLESFYFSYNKDKSLTLKCDENENRLDSIDQYEKYKLYQKFKETMTKCDIRNNLDVLYLEIIKHPDLNEISNNKIFKPVSRRLKLDKILDP
jgi:hypothetical protein